MTRVRPFAVPGLAWLTGSQAAEVDARAIRERGVPQPALMERAGAGAAAVLHRVVAARRALVLAGKGNNGGDALVLARTLAAWGWEVEILLTASRDEPDPLLHGWDLPSRTTASLPDGELDRVLAEALGRDGVVVDGILGTGIQGAPRGEAGRVVGRLEALGADGPSGALVAALDIPSGVEADTGAVPGPAVRAHLTVSFGWPKLGALLHPGRARGGRLVALEIGFPPLDDPLSCNLLLTPAWAAAHRPRRPPVTHKNQVGALAVVAGRPGMAGAAVLAGRAALRSGAGYVRIVTAPENREVVQAALPEGVFVDAADASAVDEALAASRALAVGPAMGTDRAAGALLDRVLAAGLPAVVDADALTLLGERGFPGPLMGDRAVLTPHPGEAGRLLGRDPIPEPERRSALEALREASGATVLLKGSPSLVLGDGGLWIDTVGSSDLAVAGMGDTLTGTVGAFLAQGCPPQEAAGLGLVATGRAAARAGKGVGLQSADVPEYLPAALDEGPGETDLHLPGVLLDLDPSR